MSCKLVEREEKDLSMFDLELKRKTMTENWELNRSLFTETRNISWKLYLVKVALH